MIISLRLAFSISKVPTSLAIVQIPHMCIEILKYLWLYCDRLWFCCHGCTDPCTDKRFTRNFEMNMWISSLYLFNIFITYPWWYVFRYVHTLTIHFNVLNLPLYGIGTSKFSNRYQSTNYLRLSISGARSSMSFFFWQRNKESGFKQSRLLAIYSVNDKFARQR